MRFGWSREVFLYSPWSPMRAARIWAGLTQRDLAVIVGCSRETISAVERGASLPSVTLALAIAGVLNTTVEELFSADVLR